MLLLFWMWTISLALSAEKRERRRVATDVSVNHVEMIDEMRRKNNDLMIRKNDEECSRFFLSLSLPVFSLSHWKNINVKCVQTFMFVNR